MDQQAPDLQSLENPKPFSKNFSTDRAVLIGFCLLAAVCFVWLLVVKKPWEIVVPAGKETSVPFCVAIYEWYGVAVFAVGILGLGLTACWWLKPRPVSPPPEPPRSPRWFWPVVLSAIVFSAGINGPRLTAGFWDDEEYSMRRSIAGTFRASDDGTVKFKQIPWRDTLFYYQKPNNHILNSVFARVANSAWCGVARPSGLPYSEPVVRFPAFLAGLGGIAASACLLRLLGLPGAGVLAAWLLALHPWHARFTPEVRGYAFLFLLVPLACLLAIKAVRDGRWRWWLGSGLCQFAMLYAWAGSLEFLLLLNAGIFVLILLRVNRLSNVTRFGVSSMLAGLISLVLYAPCATQFLKYSKEMDFTPIDGTWVVNVAARFVTGLSWMVAYPESHPSASAMFAASPILGVLVTLLVVLGLVAGCIRFLGTGWERACLLPVLLLPAPIFTIMALLKNMHLFEWYVVGALTGFVIVAATGLAWLASWASRGNLATAALLGVVVCGAFGLFNASSLNVLLERPICPIREAVLMTRPNLDPYDPKQNGILTAFIFGPPHIYDPHARRIGDVEDLKRLMQESADSGKPLFLNESYTDSVRESHPELLAMLMDRTKFHQTRLPGIEPMFDRDVFRYVGGE